MEAARNLRGQDEQDLAAEARRTGFLNEIRLYVRRFADVVRLALQWNRHGRRLNNRKLRQLG
jgi:hypothetical protein